MLLNQTNANNQKDCRKVMAGRMRWRAFEKYESVSYVHWKVKPARELQIPSSIW